MKSSTSKSFESLFFESKLTMTESNKADEELAEASQAAANDEKDGEKIQGNLTRHKRAKDEASHSHEPLK